MGPCACVRPYVGPPRSAHVGMRGFGWAAGASAHIRQCVPRSACGQADQQSSDRALVSAATDIFVENSRSRRRYRL